MKQLTLSFLLMLLPLLASAEPVEINGIWYNLIPKGKVAEVTWNPNHYKGNVVIPSTFLYDGIDYTVTSINGGSFLGCREVTSITIPNTINTIGQEVFERFYDEIPIYSIYITDLEAWCNITFLGSDHQTFVPYFYPLAPYRLFLNGNEVKDLVIPNTFETIKSNTFSNNVSIESVTIPSSVTLIDYRAFDNCTNLSSVHITDLDSWCRIIFNSNPLECADHLYLNEEEIKDLVIPSSVTSFGSAFSGCSGLTSVTIGNNVTTIGSSAFYCCSGLSSVTIGNNVTNIGSLAFYACTSLTSINIPNSVTSIDGGAFSDCSKLKTVTLGKSVSFLSNSFNNCQQLTDVYCLSENVPNTSADAFNSSYIEYATLHVPESAINAYKATAPWSGFGSIVTIEGDDTPETPKCATPTISIENGKVKFSCETEGVEFVSSVSAPDANNYNGSELTLSYKYNVSVYAIKDGYENSDTATAEITATGKFGDMNHDNKITVADAVIIIDKVMKNEE